MYGHWYRNGYDGLVDTVNGTRRKIYFGKRGGGGKHQKGKKKKFT